MANIISNKLTLIGSDEKVKKCIEKIKGDNVLIPCPIDFEKILPLAGEAPLTVWGCRENSCFPEFLSAVVPTDDKSISFYTYWDTPRPVMIELSKQNPELEFEIKYADEFPQEDGGIYRLKNGKYQKDITFEKDSRKRKSLHKELFPLYFDIANFFKTGKSD